MMHETSQASGRRPTGRWACGLGPAARALLAAAALLAGAALPGTAAPAVGSDPGNQAETTGATAVELGPPTAGLRRQLDRAQLLLQSRLAVLPAGSGVLLVRDPDRLTLRIPARLLFEYDTPVLWQQQPVATSPAATSQVATPAAATSQVATPDGQQQGQPQGQSQNQEPAPLAIPLLATVHVMKKYQALQAQIVVYTDSIGSVSANQSLSDARAQAVYQALTAAGVAPDRLQQRGAGATTMVAGNQTPQGRIENRRVEIEFRPEPAAAP
jgi:hypothetical protein